MSKFFINRPIFATVIALITIIAGMVTLFSLPIEQYPEISPPTVSVSAFYPGANSKTIADTVGAPIEQQVNGVENMLYMSSVSSNNGDYQLTVTFEIGTDVDMAQVLVQNRVSLAEPTLPEEVRRTGVEVKKQSTNIVQMIALTSDDKTMDELFLSNYATLYIKDELARLNGVGEILVFGADDYSMRLWLDPNRLQTYDITASDVAAALREQNVQVAAGQIGQAPTDKDQTFNFVINTKGRLSSVDEFKEIIVKNINGKFVRIKDIARVELDSKTYSYRGQVNGKPSAILAILQLPGSNALDLAKAVEGKMKELSKFFPKGMEYSIPYDTTKFVKASIEEVVITLIVAILLVFITIYVFLQDWRATLIPAATIPVSLIGTFAMMQVLGFSINMLSLFGLILAIGIVVDDAIVVVENTSRNIDEYGLSAKEATIKAMDEVTGPVIATTLVLMAVFVPTGFMEGITGRMYKQFALTIAASTFFSSINALTLSPALCALILRPSSPKKNIFFRWFNTGFDKFRAGYNGIVGFTLRKGFIIGIIFLGLLAFSVVGIKSLPTGFVPQEDQGYVIAAIQLPDGSSFARTKKVIQQIDSFMPSVKGVSDWIAVPGYSVLDGTMLSSGATLWISFDPWEDRQTPELKQEAIIATMNKLFYTVQDAQVFAFVPPPISGLGTTGGFELKLQDKGNLGYKALQDMTYMIAAEANKDPILQGVFSTFRANVPQIYANIDRIMAKNMNIDLNELYGTLQSYLGSSYVNDFNIFGRTYQVNMQADYTFRNDEEDFYKIQIRNRDGRMVPLGSLLKLEKVLGPQIINRYNLYPAATINGGPAPGFSSGQAILAMEKILNEKLPNSMGYEWTGTAFQEKRAGGQAVFVLMLSIVLVYLVLCAQYESWALPIGVILAVPLALIGTVVALYVAHIDLNVYGQIGLVLLVALASKNAILIVEFAKEEHLKGKSIVEAAATSASLRLRPILMTSFAFILGVWPLVVASGAAAASRRSLGTAVFGGMIAATFMTVLFVPYFFATIEKFSSKGKKHDPQPPSTPAGNHTNESDSSAVNSSDMIKESSTDTSKQESVKTEPENEVKEQVEDAVPVHDKKEKELPKEIVEENKKLKDDLDVLKKAFKIISKDN
jgi:HAE1 family hydrophobic/amphiphilic exporter-1